MHPVVARSREAVTRGERGRDYSSVVSSRTHSLALGTSEE